MTTAARSLFVVGKRELGILFVRTNPLRVTLVTPEAIKQFEDETTSEDGFAEACGMATVLAADLDKSPATKFDQPSVEGVKELIKAGVQVSGGDFSYAVEMRDTDDHDYQRFAVNPLWNVWSNIVNNDLSAQGEVTKANLETFARDCG